MIIPAIDLIDGQVVRLYQGDYQQKTQFALDPLTQLLSYQEQGAQWLHLVDLDGAKQPLARQTQLLTQLITALDCQVQVGGGVRSEQDLQTLLECGSDRVVIGSLAVKQPQLVGQWLERYGQDAICLALDINIINGVKSLAVSGWQQDAGVALESLMDQFLSRGLKHALVTDISRDGTLKGPNVDLYQQLSQAYPHVCWQGSGGVASLDDIKAMRDSGASGIIVGKALLEQRFNVKEAIQCWPNV
ncbi:1-(5-phosphoribosyl)-5-[(5-phosphoribosylamino)methylideneamino]imidazole-4-carboxamide isomerase [Shewanella sp. NIFS-20-20]|uniref:1-(5-phosphoribosyl)-5-[(5- phosphoribosylamino)methylideneamino]imidazole-4- carboxamide isomerase n=1 Tax=Shewanella sp. NIFS-20-20 TaxID=2853806 RepID=UPI001C440A35|nr:1-(5-phosphoribosyl)-5-[(5-phosphoribosylamino)methylideneamino]imidazole-4-carboxamide isomerase [Shewanella sp. NIFS-20-20]MBV7314398.1 1-(5-phosphoribosyl)-5-[(5-phosphoribosylamino)methylideneamino]imidazole-4-carboxamide isomerase [Shewanella sp. NIFS-20-20]